MATANATLHGLPAEGKTLRQKLQNFVVTSSVALGFLLLLGHYLRKRSKWLRALHLPASLLGGLSGWLIFAFVELCGGEAIADEWFSVGWDVLPGFCTNLIFCCLFLGTPVPAAGEVLQSPRREHLIYGLVVVFGQYVTSSLMTALVRLADPSLPAQFATVMPYGYAGGPVVAEAMEPLYNGAAFSYPDGYPLALLAATVGMFVGVIAGAVLVNMAPLTHKGRASRPLAAAAADRASRRASDAADAHGLAMRSRTLPAMRGGGGRLSRMRASMYVLKQTASKSDHYPPGEWPASMSQTVSSESLDSLMFHLCLVAIVLLSGYLLRLPFVVLEETFPKDSFLARASLLSVLPLFLFCLLGGLAIQKFIDRWLTDERTGLSFIDRPTILAISNTAQDILIVAAISRLGRNGLPPGVHGLGSFLNVVFSSGLPLLLVCAAGLAWGVVAFWYIAPRLLPDYWAERALVEFGVSIGATSTGLLLLRMADAEGRTPVLRDFTFKQIFHVLITGGGFFDVLVPIPITAVSTSPWPLLLVALLAIATALLYHPGAGKGGRRLARRLLRKCLRQPPPTIRTLGGGGGAAAEVSATMAAPSPDAPARSGGGDDGRRGAGGGDDGGGGAAPRLDEAPSAASTPDATRSETRSGPGGEHLHVVTGPLGDDGATEAV